MYVPPARTLTRAFALVLAIAAPASAQVSCVRHEHQFECADGTSLAIYDEPTRLGTSRGGGGLDRGEGRGDRGGGLWWKDDSYLHGPDGEVCLQHGTHVHCGGVRINMR